MSESNYDGMGSAELAQHESICRASIEQAKANIGEHQHAVSYWIDRLADLTARLAKIQQAQSNRARP